MSEATMLGTLVLIISLYAVVAHAVQTVSNAIKTLDKTKRMRKGTAPLP